jgi:glycosyltransferase involved in cell wall biosynthesis
MRVSIIIPCYNESQSVGGVIRKVRTLLPDAEIIAVDDGSSDNTTETALRAGATVYRHPYNIGNGAAIKTGIRKARGDVLVFLDADGQHDPEDLQRLLDSLPTYDMAVGARSLRGQASLMRGLGNKVYNWLASYVTNFRVQDLTSGFRAVKADIAKSFIYLLPNTYSYPTTITLGVLRSGMSINYIPIKVHKRQRGASSINVIRDGVRFFMIITRICTLYSPMRVFLPVSGGMALLGLVNYAHTYLSQGRFTNMSALMFVGAIVIFMMSLVSEQICQMRYERRTVDRRKTIRMEPQEAADFRSPNQTL